MLLVFYYCTVNQGSVTSAGVTIIVPLVVLDADNPHVPLPSREITLETGIAIDRIAVDSATNRVFVPAKHAGDPATTHRLYVIDGSANTWIKVTYEHQLLANSQPRDVAVDQLHKRIYVLNFGTTTNSLSVLDLNRLTLLTAATLPGGLAADVGVDPAMSLVYVATSVQSNLASRGIGMVVLDGVSTTAFAPAAAGSQPQPNAVEGKSWGLAVAPGSRRVYLANPEDRSVSVVQALRMPGTTDLTQKRLRSRARLEQAVQAFAEPTPLLPLVMHTLARGLQGVQTRDLSSPVQAGSAGDCRHRSHPHPHHTSVRRLSHRRLRQSRLASSHICYDCHDSLRAADENEQSGALVQGPG